MNLLFPRNNEILFENYYDVYNVHNGFKKFMEIRRYENKIKRRFNDIFQRKNVDSVDMSCEYKYVKSNWI
jgi:hypothetical protein